MKAFVRNFAGIKRADLLELDAGITLACGANGAGKSSLLQACGAALCGTPNVRGLRFKNQAARLVHAGAQSARVRLEGSRGEVGIEWPDCKIVAEGDAPAGDAIAVGLRRYADLEAKARGAYLIEVLEAEPTGDDLARALADAEIKKPQVIDKLWERIQQQGWDATHAATKTHGAKLKGKWEVCAGGVKYGVKKAREWMPNGWEEDLFAASIETLEAAVVAARKEVEAQVGRSAVSQDRLADLRTTAEEGEAAAAQIGLLEETIENLTVGQQQKGEDRAKLPPVSEETTAACPHCGEPVVVKATDRLEKPDHEPVPAAELAERKRAIAEADEDLRWGEEQIRKEQDKLVRLRDQVARGTAAKNEIAKMSEARTDEKALDQARRALDRAEKRKAAFAAQQESVRLLAGIATNQAIVAALAPDGVRQTVIAGKLKEFNSLLADLSKQYKIAPVAVDQDLELCLDGRPYPMLSRSEQHRADSVLQVGLALRTEAPLMIIDEVDILDPASRPGLLRMLRWSKVPALLGMTAANPARCPNLEEANIGRTLWVENGEIAAIERAPSEGGRDA